MTKINIIDPQPRQILIYDEVTGSFLNRDAGEIFESESLNHAKNMADIGVPVFNKIIDKDTLQFRSIVGGNQIRVRNMHSYIEIGFTGDAYTIRGKEPSDFLAVENNLSEVNRRSAREHLEVYSMREAHDEFMETNSSNIPDRDNVYDLGSNGNRYSDIYAVNFHGTASRALYAESLTANGASDGDMLVWSRAHSAWIPKQQESYKLTDLDDITTDNSPKDGDILVFNNDNKKWEYVEYVPFEPDTSGSIVALNTVGNGESIIRSRVGDIIELRSLRAGSNIVIEPVSLSNELSISAVVPYTTDDLLEGDDNLYYTDKRVRDEISSTPLNIHADVVNTTPQEGQALVRLSGQWVNKDVLYDVYDTDGLPEGNNNLYFTEDRVITVMESQLSGGFFAIGDLSDTNTTTVSGTYLYFNGTNWVNRTPSTDDLSEGSNNLFYTDERVQGVLSESLAGGAISLNANSDVTITNPVGGNVLRHNGTNWTNAVLSTDDLSEGSNNEFYTDEKVQGVLAESIASGIFSIDDLSDVTSPSPSAGNVLVYSGSAWVPQTLNMSYPLFNNYRTKSVQSTSVIDFEAANVHRISGTTDTTITLQGTEPNDEAINVVICIEGYGATITWPSAINWNNGTEPNLGPNWTNIILFWTGSMWVGMISGRG